jgi:hypothetical protein
MDEIARLDNRAVRLCVKVRKIEPNARLYTYRDVT